MSAVVAFEGFGDSLRPTLQDFRDLGFRVLALCLFPRLRHKTESVYTHRTNRGSAFGTTAKAVYYGVI